ncbi:MAG: hypothetical protein R3A78_12325 [Polyangiales bacterium]|nr:hypothetical protein [Myxococcales bacterium]
MGLAFRRCAPRAIRAFPLRDVDDATDGVQAQRVLEHVTPAGDRIAIDQCVATLLAPPC